ncbi:dynein heavy chain 12, axonemal [Trichonephila clavipes]|nr:dynein heavy chain 12, axonemal [Trichonephila clavipes]
MHPPTKYDAVVSEDDLRSLMFGTYINYDESPADRLYDEVTSIETFEIIADKCLSEYNSFSKSPVDMVIFRYVLEHLSRLCRILSMSGGNALLVGVGGSGRQSVTKLAAFITGQWLFQPEITKNYGLNEWRDDIKSMMSFSNGSRNFKLGLMMRAIPELENHSPIQRQRKGLELDRFYEHQPFYMASLQWQQDSNQ